MYVFYCALSIFVHLLPSPSRPPQPQDPIDLTGEEDALQKALALSIQEMHRQPGGGGISIEEQELSRWVLVRAVSGIT